MGDLFTVSVWLVWFGYLVGRRLSLFLWAMQFVFGLSVLCGRSCLHAFIAPTRRGGKLWSFTSLYIYCWLAGWLTLTQATSVLMMKMSTVCAIAHPAWEPRSVYYMILRIKSQVEASQPTSHKDKCILYILCVLCLKMEFVVLQCVAIFWCAVDDD